MRVSLVGTGRSLINYNSSFEIKDVPVWATPRAGLILLEKGYRVDYIFQIDDMEMKYRHFTKNKPEFNFSNDTQELFDKMTHAWPFSKHTKLMLTRLPRVNYPHMNIMPMERLTQWAKTDFIIDSGSFMLACAMFYQAYEIDFHGFDFNPDHRNESREAQAECFGYWFGRATERGIKLNVNPACRLNNKFQYAQRGHRSRGMSNEIIKKLPTTNQVKFEAFYESKEFQKEVQQEELKFRTEHPEYFHIAPIQNSALGGGIIDLRTLSVDLKGLKGE